MKIISKPKNSDIKRINEIYKVLKKNDFGYLIEENTFFKTFPFLRNRKLSKDKELPEEAVAVRIRNVFEDLGPAFIKLGQMLSTRPDLVGIEISKELQKLRDEAPVTEFNEMKKVLEMEFNTEVDEIYEYIDETPIGSASIGQVYTAKLKENGAKVAIKIQKPNIEEIIKTDIRLMKFLVARIDRFLTQAQVYNLPAIVEEFEKSILKEINYLDEVRNIEIMGENFKDIPYVHIPEIWRSYCSEKVITMELIEGIKLSELIEDDCPEYNKKLIAKSGMNSFFKQVMIDGFFHADPHPGNIIILKDNKICYIDMGMMGILDDNFRKNLAELILILANGNADNLINQLVYMDILTPVQNTPELKEDLNDLLKKYYGAELKNVDSSLDDLLKVMIKHDVILPKEFVMIGRGVTLLEESGKKLNPEFNTASELRRLSRKILLNKINPEKLAIGTVRYLLEIEHLAKNLPTRIGNTLTKLEQGELSVKIRLEGITDISKQLTTAIIIAALIVGSSLALFADKGPTFLDIPILGLGGYLISFALGIYLVIQFIMIEFD